MSRVSRFRVLAPLDMSRPQEGTLAIDRDAGLVSVRPLRRRREYTLPLSRVAAFIVQTIIRAEAAEKRRTKAKGRRKLVGKRLP